eukprot:TRINITY_DN14761_c0_g1_i1.p1 TRINITY_DN14761_c0_g1~~TRINITY_DN14761_c0_g1_i1.p1  ORF type:complete len:400 (+),score=50.52 TRINITY_DN14761_c0_g1_i1:93-1292(+)
MATGPRQRWARKTAVVASRAVLWLRNDLRVHDNQLFHFDEVRHATELIAVYCIDPRHYETSPWGDHARTGRHRARFLAESLRELHETLQRLGHERGLLVFHSRPEDILPALLDTSGQRNLTSALVFQSEDTHEEQLVEHAVLQRLSPEIVVMQHYGHTLYHRGDLGFDPTCSLPVPFGKFKFGVCDSIGVRPELPPPIVGGLAPAPRVEELVTGTGRGPSLARGLLDASNVSALCEAMGVAGVTSEEPANTSQAADAFVWKGGESAAWQQLTAYVSEGLAHYQKTRNQLQGTNVCSRLSPWMANGCLSARSVYWQAKKTEAALHGRVKDLADHIYKFVFQLTWRDYFRFYCARFGKSVFFSGGPALRLRPWRRDAEAESRWKHGHTGVPIVDALSPSIG